MQVSNSHKASQKLLFLLPVIAVAALSLAGCSHGPNKKTFTIKLAQEELNSKLSKLVITPKNLLQLDADIITNNVFKKYITSPVTSGKAHISSKYFKYITVRFKTDKGNTGYNYYPIWGHPTGKIIKCKGNYSRQIETCEFIRGIKLNRKFINFKRKFTKKEWSNLIWNPDKNLAVITGKYSGSNNRYNFFNYKGKAVVIYGKSIRQNGGWIVKSIASLN